VSALEQVGGLENQEGVDEVDGDNNNGDLEQEGIDEPDGLDNNDLEVGDQVDQQGENENGNDEGGAPAPPVGTGQIGQIGQHRP
jgi:hypothetical protein